jgi:hypothetical protein
MDDEVIVLTGNKSKAVLLLLASAAFVAVGIALVADGKDMGWGVIIFFGLGLLTSIYMLTPNAIRLQIDKNGVEMKTLFKPMKLEWGDVNGFYVSHLQTGYSKTKLIGIEFSESYKKMRAGRQLSSALTGMEGGLPNHFNRSAEEICELLNKSKQKWEPRAAQLGEPDRTGGERNL